MVDSDVGQDNEIYITTQRDVSRIYTLSETNTMADAFHTATYTSGFSQVDPEGSIGR